MEKEFLHGINRADEMRKDYFENGLTKEEADEKYYNRMHNCYFCTQAAIMRLKGYEVKAQAADRGFPTRLTDPILWENSLVSTERFQDRSEVMKCLADRNDYSYGNISVKWKAGYAHSMIWVKTNDQVIIMDGQLERIRGRYFIKTGEFSSNLEKVFERMDVSKTKLTDLTNAKPTDYMLKMIE